MNAVWSYFTQNQVQIWDWLQTTVWLALVPLVAALAIALPLGALASRFRWSYPPLVTAGGTIYTIPSIVLFLALPGILGTPILSPINVAVTLTLYGVALLVRTVADALIETDPTTLAAARAVGLTPWQQLIRVQLPLALPVIGAGVRVAAVSNVSLIAVASALGVSQLGSLFTAGFNTNSVAPVVLGLIMFVALALLLDGILLLGIRSATPWKRAGGAA